MTTKTYPLTYVQYAVPFHQNIVHIDYMLNVYSSSA